MKVKIHSCGTYHPYRHRGEKNPKAGDQLSRAMMDLKDEANQNHKKAIQIFAELIIKELDEFLIGPLEKNKKFVSVPFEVTVVPSHKADHVSPALKSIAQKICIQYSNGKVVQSLQRKTTVASAHKEGGDRSVANHMATIEVVTEVLGKVVLVIDDVTTTGGSMAACINMLKSGGADTVLPLALLETANYEE
ncbi:phosphoribosyltransferase [Pectobacterium carotovorum]|uniref:phosphoribosyltransferase n=1 Tax=Pectobacterium carotovorum TaxID=554 RepID=UPI002116D0FE|nr:phosphoribosyltransferase [Pectobacterium carotovorum]MCQ8231108.1 phosphoribosyltransferase [Pectobacterium carotovorum]